MSYADTMDEIAKAIEIVGVAIIVVGGLIALVRAGVELPRDRDVTASYRGLRSFLGRSILLGLEVLVAADLIRTVAVEPTLNNVEVLGILVLIRTLLSFALELEVSGRWPWQRARADDGRL